MSRELIMNLAAWIVPAVEVLGIVTAVHAVMFTRSAQSAVAWAVSLVAIPWLALPLYWIFGRSRFAAYVEVLRAGRRSHAEEVEHILARLEADRAEGGASLPRRFRVFERLAGLPFTGGNVVDLLVDGRAFFDALLAEVDRARSYVLLQYYIVRDDGIGRALKERLERKARGGVRVYFLYDEIGCAHLPGRYLEELRAAGIEAIPFGTAGGKLNRFSLNFRNHRKITVVDGRCAFVGGHNVGDEYLGRDPRIGPWRDTHVRVNGPAVRHIQWSFMEDWYWASRRVLHLSWDAALPQAGGRKVLVLPTGPADEVEACSLAFVHAVTAARKRFWLASPYFVPDEALLKALRLAALRGVDVRIMLPLKPDHRVVHLASYAYLPALDLPGISVYRYQPGFLHQKVFLVDDHLAAVGTANADNRSFRLNFEILLLVADPGFAAETAGMLEGDFARCRPLSADEEYHRRGLHFRAAVQVANLLSPIL